IDETLKDERTTARHFGRSMKGQHAAKKEVFVCGHWVSGLGLLTVDGMIAVAVIKGSFTTPTYKTFLKEEVVSLVLIYTMLLMYLF
ncbi:hypothetical protein EDB19DRAFT_1638345, partial [Suillus lakei]